ncbi:hypothetical protein ILYODFUR_018903 [Ilyodon furcidens]|uniref:Splicing factor 3B subunit 5 n=2 Tax=Goodeidae TaxID=28758 RepID=A0ABV0TNU3_9TELE
MGRRRGFHYQLSPPFWFIPRLIHCWADLSKNDGPHRDSYCSYMGHFDLLNYFSVAENESKARVRFNLMEKMLQPCGPPADKPDDA